MGNYKRTKKGQKDADDAIVGASSGMDLSFEFGQALKDAARQSDTSSIRDRKSNREDAVWATDNLLTFPEFCSSADHMNFPPLSERQRMVAEYMMGNDPKKAFHNGRNTAVLVWGKGGSKDTMSALLILYNVYLLLNIKNPQRFLGLPDNVNIDLLNIASTKQQAQEVYFQIFRTLVLNWKWLRNKWDLVINGRFFSSSQGDDFDVMHKVTVTNDAVVFPGNIRAFSGSCEAESLEGHNIFLFVLDEADAFKVGSMHRSAVKIYRTVRTSAVSRFGSNYKSFILSYPRSSNGFIMQMYNQSKKSLSMYGDIAATWEVKPRELFSKESFEFEGKSIPMDFYDEFRLDPIGSKAAYLCDPPEAESLFLEDPDKVDVATKGFVRPLFEFRDTTEDKMVRKYIDRSPFMPDQSIQYILVLDLGHKNDATALSMMHRDQDRVVVDFSTAWVPDEVAGSEVDFQNIEDMIEQLRKCVSIGGIYGDRWQSVMLFQKLRSRGVKAENIKLEMDDFEMFKRLLYAGNIQLPKHERLLAELKGLQRVSQTRIHHPDGAHDDMAVTIIMGVRVLAKAESGAGGIGLLAEGEFVGDNLDQNAESGMEFEPEKGDGIQIDGFML